MFALGLRLARSVSGHGRELRDSASRALGSTALTPGSTKWVAVLWQLLAEGRNIAGLLMREKLRGVVAEGGQEGCDTLSGRLLSLSSY